MKRFSPKLFFVVLAALLLSHCSDKVKLGEDKNTISITDAWIDDVVDDDGDGYYSYARVYFEINSDDPVTLFAVVGYRYTDAEPTYYIYKTTVTFDVDGSRTLWVALGDEGYEVADGIYDLTLEIYDESDPENMITSRAAEKDADLQSIAMEYPENDQPVVEVEIFNPLFTTIDVTVGSFGTQSVDPSGSALFYVTGGLTSVYITGSTSGKTSTGTVVGLPISWGFSQDISGVTYKSVELTLSSTYMFIYVTNTGEVAINGFYVNYGDAVYQTFDDISIPNNGTKYRIGYYRAFSNTQIRGYVPGHSQWDYVYWDNSINAFIPFTDNQSVSLTNSLKTSDGNFEKLAAPSRTWKTKDGLKPQKVFGEEAK